MLQEDTLKWSICPLQGVLAQTGKGMECPGVCHNSEATRGGGKVPAELWWAALSWLLSQELHKVCLKPPMSWSSA